LAKFFEDVLIWLDLAHYAKAAAQVECLQLKIMVLFLACVR